MAKTPDIKPKRADVVPANIGTKMRKWRGVAGMSQLEVGEKIGCTKGHISGAENGNGNFSLPLFLKFCRAIGTPASKLLGDGMLRIDAKASARGASRCK